MPNRLLSVPCAAAVLAAALAALPAAAQRATVRGHVVDARSGQPIAGAAVQARQDDAETVTDVNGQFVLRRLRPGSQVLTSTRVGYRPGAAVVALSGADVSDVRVELEPDPVMLQALNVTVSRFELRAHSYAGQVLAATGAELANTSSSDMMNFVRTHYFLHLIPCPGRRGSESTHTCIFRRGHIVDPEIYVDETQKPNGFDLLSFYNPAEIARVEVYDHGTEIRMYTYRFMAWAATHNFQPEHVFRKS